MNKIFITSSIGSSKKINGIRVATPLDNTYKFIDRLKEQMDSKDNFVMICSDPDNHTFNDMKFKILQDSLALSGILFNNYYLIDGRITNIEDLLNTASLIYLDGGHPQIQMSYFKQINLSAILLNLNTVIIGNSAGSMNLAKDVYCAPEDISQINDNKFYEGLGLTNINIEPHFINDESNFDYNQKNLRKILYDDSYDVNITCITDGSYIYQKGSDIMYYGEIYKIQNGEKEKVINANINLGIRNK